MDKRHERHELPDISSKGGKRSLIIEPDMVGDFTALPWPDQTFALVVFDPPHLVRNGKKGWLALKYGKLEGDWREQLRQGFAECFRVLKNEGTLVFKWNENDVPVSEILALTPSGRSSATAAGKTPSHTGSCISSRTWRSEARVEKPLMWSVDGAHELRPQLRAFSVSTGSKGAPLIPENYSPE